MCSVFVEIFFHCVFPVEQNMKMQEIPGTCRSRNLLFLFIAEESSKADAVRPAGGARQQTKTVKPGNTVA